MKLVCERDKMLAAFATAGAVVPSRSPKPILQNVKLEVSEGSAVLLATDLEIGIRVELPGVEVERAGMVILPAQRFGLILRESGDERLSLEADATGTIVKGERSQFRLPGENPEEFPSVPHFAEKSYYEISSRLLREMIRRTAFATDNESTRYALGGVLLETSGDRLTAVGTDGRRLATQEGPIHAVGGAVDEGSPIVPSKAMHLIERALAESGTEVMWAAKPNHVLVKSERVTIYSRLVEGRFPKWREVFPKREQAVRVDLSVGPLYSAVRQAAIVTSEDSRGVTFAFGDGKLVLTGQSSNLGRAQVELPIATEVPNLSITLDPRFVTDFLKVLDPEKTFTLELKDAESAAVCTTDDGYSYVIMPLARDS